MRRVACGCCRDDSYMGEPALPTVQKIRLYYDSLMRFEGHRQPLHLPALRARRAASGERVSCMASCEFRPWVRGSQGSAQWVCTGQALCPDYLEIVCDLVDSLAYKPLHRNS